MEALDEKIKNNLTAINVIDKMGLTPRINKDTGQIFIELFPHGNINVDVIGNKSIPLILFSGLAFDVAIRKFCFDDIDVEDLANISELLKSASIENVIIGASILQSYTGSINNKK